ncbi:MAG: hypothetical protein A2V85_13590 [Chloroflexi bacterium RBG_16_72_14]|nr:MAG: hypothetical protein A2V85_13590 [Chloroflexi bacterium RBG_16_72_14]
MSNRTILPATVLLVTLATIACTSPGATGSPGGSASPTAAPASPSSEGIAHPTGADDIVLRYDESGGFVPVEFLAAHVPYFTLYGDGTVVFVSNEPVVFRENQPAIGQSIRTAKLSEAQIQDLIEFALADGGLAIAREQYDNPMVADAPTAVFEINADGDSKTVSVMALGIDAEPGPDTAIKTTLAKLGERLRDFDAGGSLASQPYAPAAYRGILLEAAGVQGVNVRDWPWPELALADFNLPADASVLQQRTRVLTPSEAEAVDVAGFEAGVQSGLYYRVDDVLYSFVLRPLLPDEDA